VLRDSVRAVMSRKGAKDATPGRKDFVNLRDFVSWWFNIPDHLYIMVHSLFSPISQICTDCAMTMSKEISNFKPQTSNFKSQRLNLRATHCSYQPIKL
jgi:hypothetical protein